MSFIKNIFFPAAKTVDPLADSASDNTTVETNFTPQTLSKYNGHDEAKIYIAIKGTVFDVSQGRQFYGPSGPYSNFAGHDASRGLALNSFEMDTIRGFDQPIDDLKGLSKDELEALNGWEEHFRKKYPVVGKLVEPPAPAQ